MQDLPVQAVTPQLDMYWLMVLNACRIHAIQATHAYTEEVVPQGLKKLIPALPVLALQCIQEMRANPVTVRMDT